MILQIFGCNTIEAVYPFLQAAVIAVYVLDMVNAFDTLFSVGLESVMSQALCIRIGAECPPGIRAKHV
jgi:hypothetical protein